MEFYLVIDDDVIELVKYYTDGCEYTRLCGTAVARRVKGRSLREAIAISARQILDELPELPQENHHCAILAVSTFYRAVGQFWIDKAMF
jgi:nitrogen fixation NifU-like protein